jgi:hypothetical protein
MPPQTSQTESTAVSKAIADAKFKAARLRLMKQRNELYSAEQKEERNFEWDDDEETKELGL